MNGAKTDPWLSTNKEPNKSRKNNIGINQYFLLAFKN
jgi:hypothetical protein